MSLINIFSDTKRVGSSRELALFLDSHNTAILLQQFIYCHTHSTHDNQAFYNTYADIGKQVIMSVRQVRYQVDKFVKRGWIELRVSQVNGFKTTWFKLNFNLIDLEFTEWQKKTKVDDKKSYPQKNPFQTPINTGSDNFVNRNDNFVIPSDNSVISYSIHNDLHNDHHKDKTVPFGDKSNSKPKQEPRRKPNQPKRNIFGKIIHQPVIPMHVPRKIDSSTPQNRPSEIGNSIQGLKKLLKTN